MFFTKYRSLRWAAILLGALTLLALRAAQAAAPPLREVKLTVSPAEVDDEASGLLPIEDRTFLKSGWTEGFWVILDEPPVERAIARLGRGPNHTGPAQGWEIEMVPARVQPGQEGATNDCEAIARSGDYVYIFGSHFGKKNGPLEAERQFVARFADRATSAVAVSAPLSLEVARDHFLLHRLINDALTTSGLELIGRGPAEYKRYIEKTLKKQPEAAGRVREGDRPINIEGAAFLDSGALLLGLRYPVTRDGHPILVELSGIERLFSGGQPKVEGFWVLQNVGDSAQPVGIRDMLRRGQLDLLTGNLDRLSNKKGERGVIEDHPEGLRASSRHYRMAWPPANSQGRLLRPNLVRDLAPSVNAEGLAADPQGRFYYVFDENQVRLQYETGANR